jgi:hypothetical protein
MGSPETDRARFVVNPVAAPRNEIEVAWIGMQQTLNYPGFW